MTILTENSQSQNSTASKLPDGPKEGKFIQTVKGILNPLDYLEKKHQQYGDIFTSQFSLW